jgi:dihydroflavonol-4-reductase
MILVTGATGHIGNVLVRKLVDSGHKVRAMVLPGEEILPLNGLPVEMVEANVTDINSLTKPFEGVRTVFHLAGIISILPGHDKLVWNVNVKGTQNALQAAKAAGVERFIYTSSIHALKRIDAGVIDERLPFDINNPYGDYDCSKAAATVVVQQAAADGLDAVIACPTGVIGPHDYRGSMMGSVILSAAERRTTPFVAGAYDFVDVRDVANGLIAAAEKGKTGESYILSGHRISVRYLLETVREITGRAFPHFEVPFNLARMAAFFTPLYYRLAKVTPRFTHYSLEVLQSNSHISHAKASSELGYQPRTIYESIQDAIRWYGENAHILKRK